MSHTSTIRTKIMDLNTLKEILRELRLDFIETENGLRLRNKNIAYFKDQVDEHYNCKADLYYHSTIVKDITRRYTLRVTERTMHKIGLKTKRKAIEKNQIELIMVRR